MAATASFELLGFRPAPARAPPCDPFVFCTFALFLFGDEVTPSMCDFVRRICSSLKTQTADDDTDCADDTDGVRSRGRRPRAILGCERLYGGPTPPEIKF